MDFSRIGKEVFDLRKAMGMSQQELCKGICSQAQISKIEKNGVYPLAPTLYLIAKKLGVDVNYFFDKVSTPNRDYVKEVEIQFRRLRKEMGYLEILEIVNYEKKNPLFLKDNENCQLLMWHEGICKHHVQNKSQKALEILERSLLLTKGKSKVSSERELEILNSISVINFEIGDYHNCLFKNDMILKQLIYLPGIKDITLKTRVLYNRAKTLTRLGKYKESNLICGEGINWCNQNENMYLFAELHYHIGYNYDLLKEYTKALSYYRGTELLFSLRKESQHIQTVQNKINELTQLIGDMAVK